MFKSKFFVMISLLFAALSFIVISCDSASMTTDKGHVEITQEPVIEEIEEVEGVRVISTTNVAYFMYSMIPDGQNADAVVGSTANDNDKVTVEGTEYNHYKIVSASANSLGYFSQGKWILTLYILDSDKKLIVKDPVIKEKVCYLNTVENTIDVNLDELLFNTNQKCTLSLSELKFELVSDPSLYNKEVLNGHVIRVKLVSLKDNSVVLTKNIDSISSFEKKDNKAVVGVIKDFTVATELQNGAYVISLQVLEHDGSKYVEAGGVSFSFHARGTACDIVSSGSALSLKASDYVTPGLGDSGIIVDQGTANTVEVTAKKGTTDIDSKTSVSVKDKVTFSAVVLNANNEEVTVQNGMWLVDGEPVKGETGSSFTYTVPDKKGKTLTITYMFLDNTSYNTISGNFYLSVKST